MDTSWFHKGLRIHLAGTYPAGGLRRSAGWAAEFTDDEKLILRNYPHLIESYHYVGKTQKYIDEIREDNRKVFLDSGAFSMFTQGITVDMDAYVAFIKRNLDIIDVASVLDGIGDPALTFENQKKLEDKGVEILPCFHYGEPIEYLEYYLQNYKHITLGGMVPIATPDLKKWLDFIWEHYLTDSSGWPLIKVHGFGLTSISLMDRYPWFSVDSTSWVLTGRFGSIFFPTKDRPDGKLTISDQSPARKTRDRHYDTLSEIERKSVDGIFARQGFIAEELRSIYWKRDLYNISFFQSITDVEVKPFTHEEQGLFDAF